MGVSGNSLIRPILLSPRPIRVSRWSWRRRAGLAICSTLIIFSAMSGAPSFGRGLAVALAPARLQRRDLDAAPGGARARRLLPCQRLEGRAHLVGGIGGADRFR